MTNLMGEKLRMLIAERGVSQKELAQKAGVTEAAISHYINGDRSPRGAILLNIANALGFFVVSFKIRENQHIRK